MDLLNSSMPDMVELADGLNKKGIAAMFGKTAFAADGSDITPEVCGGVIKYYSDQVGFENYIYSTVQYAIWNANGGVDANGNKLGDTLKGSTQLNTLYQYLIKEAAKAVHKRLRQIEFKTQSPDHPILWNMSETEYLKFYLFLQKFQQTILILFLNYHCLY